jgi:hypothetical protein
MAGTCGGATSAPVRERRVSEEEPKCEPSAEQAEQARARIEREAEVRRDAWLSSQNEGGMSSRGTSTMGDTKQVSQGPTREEKRRAEIAKKDLPLEDDPVGNALPGLLVGALVAAVGGAAPSGTASAAARGAAHHASREVQAAVMENGAHAVLHRQGALPPDSKGPSRPTERPSAPKPSPTPPGKTSPKASSQVVKEPNRSEPPHVSGQDRVPYAPGAAPVRVPDAPRGESPTVIKG